MQIDGDDGRLMALSLDVRQGSFVRGQEYKTELSVPGRLSKVSVKTVAQSESTLVMNISPRDDIYDVLRDEATLDVKIEDNQFRFYLGAFDAASNDFATCLGRVERPKAMSDIVVNATSQDDSVVWSEARDDRAPVSLLGDDVQPLVSEDGGTSVAGLDYLGIPVDSNMKVKREMITGNASFVSDSDDINALRRENADLRDELNAALREMNTEEMSIKSNNWDLERASMMFQESERQVQLLGQKLQRQENKCRAENKELEAMLFDPMVTNEQQLSRLATLEDELDNAREELELQRMRYDERIRLLEQRLAE